VVLDEAGGHVCRNHLALDGRNRRGKRSELGNPPAAKPTESMWLALVFQHTVGVCGVHGCTVLKEKTAPPPCGGVTGILRVPPPPFFPPLGVVAGEQTKSTRRAASVGK
jgi:hypothetical protein